MTTEQKLEAIKARCRELLALAEERTPGMWEAHDRSVYKKDWLIISATCHEQVAEDCPIIPYGEQQANAGFIAACAGAAEAGWRATIAAIEGLRCKNCDNTGEVEGLNVRTGEPEQQQCMVCAYQDSRIIDSILTAWEGLV